MNCGSSRHTAVLAMVLAVAGTGCASEVGDSCTTSIDCSPTGDRVCDMAQRGGYCTVQGCDARTCPEEATCVAFYATQALVQLCNPTTEDAVDPAAKATDDCRRDETCLPSGFCAMRSQERRFCMKRCADDSDCRDGYQCRQTGAHGAEAVADLEHPVSVPSRFCGERASEPGAS